MIAKESFGVMAFLIAHERIRTPNEKYSGERIALKPVFEQQDARMFSSRQLYGSLQGSQGPSSAYSY